MEIDHPECPPTENFEYLNVPEYCRKLYHLPEKCWHFMQYSDGGAPKEIPLTGDFWQQPPLSGLMKSDNLRQIVSCIARCAWLDEAEKTAHLSDLQSKKATLNAEAWAKWGRGEPWK